MPFWSKTSYFVKFSLWSKTKSISHCVVAFVSCFHQWAAELCQLWLARRASTWAWVSPQPILSCLPWLCLLSLYQGVGHLCLVSFSSLLQLQDIPWSSPHCVSSGGDFAWPKGVPGRRGQKAELGRTLLPDRVLMPLVQERKGTRH